MRDEFPGGLGPLRAQRADVGDGGAEAQVTADLIEHGFIGGFASPHLTDHVDGTALVLERAVPALIASGSADHTYKRPQR